MRKILVVVSFVLSIVTCYMLLVPSVYADAVIDNGVSFLKSKQDDAGRITTGFSAPSQWSAIAFAANGVDISTVKKVDKSLLDFLLTDIPVNDSATEYETRILAIVATGFNPSDFGGTNYVSKLENLHNNEQIGDTCSINDDVFGLLALVASGPLSNGQIKQDALDFLIAKQDPNDGGFGFSAPGCDWYSTSADMTSAALQALVEAKNSGMGSGGLDAAIDRATTYLTSNQIPDGGFGYFGSSDPDTTGWVLQAFNVLGIKDAEIALKAKNYLISQQSGTDGGIMAFDWGTSTFVSNATTTAQAIIALSGKSWILKVYEPANNSNQTTNPPLTPTTSSQSTNSPTPTSTNSNNTQSTPTPTLTPTSTPRSTQVLGAKSQDNLGEEIEEQTVEEEKSDKNQNPEVLGAVDEGVNKILIAGVFASLGALFLFIHGLQKFIIKKNLS